MEFLAPDDWQEALAAKAAHPDALPLWGGTDVMVDLNFGRERPPAILDLTRVRELAEWEERDGALRVGAGVSYSRAIADLGRATPRPGGGVPHRRLAPDPQPRHDRRQPRLLLPRRRRAAAAVRVRRRDRAGERDRHAEGPDRRLHHRPEAQHARPGRADRRVPHPPRPRAAAVREDRHAQRDGDRGLLVRARPRHRRAQTVGTCIGSAGADARPRARGRGVRAGEPRLGRGARSIPRPRTASASWSRQAASPIDDVRGSSAYRRHALSVLARRTLAWAWSERR